MSTPKNVSSKFEQKKMRLRFLVQFFILLFAFGFLEKQAKASPYFINMEIQEQKNNIVSIGVSGNEKDVVEEYRETTYEQVVISQFQQLAALICKRDALLTTAVIKGQINYKDKKVELKEDCKFARSRLVSDSTSTAYTRLVDKLYPPIQSYEVPISKGEVSAVLSKELNLYGCNRFSEIRSNLQALELCNSIYRKFK
jgi:hypothetical protein